jgi:hypothetical protein
LQRSRGAIEVIEVEGFEDNEEWKTGQKKQDVQGYWNG